MDTQQNNGIDHQTLVAEIDTKIAVLRGVIVELKKSFAEANDKLTAQEESLTQIAAINENSKKEIFNDQGSPEFLVIVKGEQATIQQEIHRTREVIDMLNNFSKQFEEQLLALLELDRNISKA